MTAYERYLAKGVRPLAMGALLVRVAQSLATRMFHKLDRRPSLRLLLLSWAPVTKYTRYYYTRRWWQHHRSKVARQFLLVLDCVWLSGDYGLFNSVPRGHFQKTNEINLRLEIFMYGRVV